MVQRDDYTDIIVCSHCQNFYTRGRSLGAEKWILNNNGFLLIKIFKHVLTNPVRIDRYMFYIFILTTIITV